MHKSKYWGLQGTSDPGLESETISAINLYLDLLHLAISELPPKLLGPIDLKISSNFWPTGSYSRELLPHRAVDPNIQLDLHQRATLQELTFSLQSVLLADSFPLKL